jgi:hypothetical protein
MHSHCSLPGLGSTDIRNRFSQTVWLHITRSPIGAWNVGLPNEWMLVDVPYGLTNGWNHLALTLAEGGVGGGTLSIFFNGVLTNSAVLQRVDPGTTSPRIGVIGNGWGGLGSLLGDYTVSPCHTYCFVSAEYIFSTRQHGWLLGRRGCVASRGGGDSPAKLSMVFRRPLDCVGDELDVSGGTARYYRVVAVP